MKHINKYTDQSAYIADTNRPKSEPTVSKIAEKMQYDKGDNLILEDGYCAIGDTVVYDKTDKRIKVVKLGSLKPATLDARYVIGGTVYNRTNAEMQVVANEDMGNAQWGHPWRAKLAGFKPAGGSFAITFNAKTTPAIAYTSGESLTAIATKIMAQLEALGETSARGISVTAHSGYIVVQQNFYTPVISTFTATEITAEVLTGNYQTELSGLVDSFVSITMENGIGTSFAGCNLERFIAYYSVSGTEDVNVTIPTTTRVKESRFNITDNPILVNHFGTYREYMKDMMIKYPYSKDAISDRNGKESTRILGSVLFTDHDGAKVGAYPSCFNALNYGIVTSGEVTGFEKGKWWLPSASEMNTLVKDVTGGIAGLEMDLINKGIADAGGFRISATDYMWTSTERSSYFSWTFSGLKGYMLYNGKTISARVRPVSAFPLLHS